MTHEEEFASLIGPLNEEDDYGLCSGCHDYPCCCTADDAMLDADWQAEIEASGARKILEPGGEEKR